MKAINLVTEARIDPNTAVLDDELFSQEAGAVQKLNVPAIFAKAGTPAVTATIPTKAGDIYINVTLSKIYIAKAATAATDFEILN